jgi:hypothetical protein
MTLSVPLFPYLMGTRRQGIQIRVFRKAWETAGAAAGVGVCSDHLQEAAPQAGGHNLGTVEPLVYRK